MSLCDDCNLSVVCLGLRNCHRTGRSWPAPAVAVGDQAKKKDAGKPQLGLIPASAMVDLAAALEVGRRKYGAHSWRKNPMEWSRVIDAMLRHIFAFAEGEDNDPQDGQPHLGAIMACAAFLSEYSRTNPEQDDRHKRAPATPATPAKPHCPPIGHTCQSCGSLPFAPCEKA